MITPKVCSEPGCIHDSIDTHHGRCEQHAPPPRWSSSTRPRLDKRKWRAIRRQVMTRDRGTCRFCAMPADTVDHRLPMAWGGPHYALANLQAMCQPCHSVKTDEERVLSNKLSRGTAGEPEIAAHVRRWT